MKKALIAFVLVLVGCSITGFVPAGLEPIEIDAAYYGSSSQPVRIVATGQHQEIERMEIRDLPNGLLTTVVMCTPPSCTIEFQEPSWIDTQPRKYEVRAYTNNRNDIFTLNVDDAQRDESNPERELPVEQEEVPIAVPEPVVVQPQENSVCGNNVKEESEECELDSDCTNTCVDCKCVAQEKEQPVPEPEPIVETPVYEESFQEKLFKNVIGNCNVEQVEEVCKNNPGGKLPCLRPVMEGEILPPFSIFDYKGVSATPIICPKIAEQNAPSTKKDKARRYISEGIRWMLRN